MTPFYIDENETISTQPCAYRVSRHRMKIRSWTHNFTENVYCHETEKFIKKFGYSVNSC